MDGYQETRCSVSQCAPRIVSFERENNQVFMKTTTENTVWRGAALLLSVAAIANKEFHSKDFLWDESKEQEDSCDLPELPDLTVDTNKNSVTSKNSILNVLAPRIDSLQEILVTHPASAAPMSTTPDDRASDSDDSHKTNEFNNETNLFSWSRSRTVSIDSPDTKRSVAPISPAPLLENATITLPDMLNSSSNLISPLNSPVVYSPRSHRLPLRKTRLRLSLKAKRDQHQHQHPQQHPQKHPEQQQQQQPQSEGTPRGSMSNTNMSDLSTTIAATTKNATNIAETNETAKSVTLMEHDNKHRSLHPVQVARDKTMKKILRKKFSWKNYPELEAFLIANREEYLRHSALNYTVQQKQYNNKLTEQLLELAAQHGYIFDENEFSFVTVRDRIRCYFKSYVQSAKKRGIIIGYAARKAGLLSQDDLERSAGTAGRIIIP